MEKKVAQALEKAEVEKKALLGSVRSMRGDQSTFRPAPGSWSALDVVHHLVLAEEAFLAYARKHRNDPPQGVSLKSRFLFVAVGCVMESKLRAKAPSPAVVPKEFVPIAVLESRWSGVRADLREMLEGLPPERIGVPLFRHPVAGRLDAVRGLEFLRQHITHHRFQIERIRSASGFPPG